MSHKNEKNPGKKPSSGYDYVSTDGYILNSVILFYH